MLNCSSSSGMSVGALDLPLVTRKLPANVLKPPYLLWREVLNSHWFRQVSMECAPFFLEYFSQWRQHCTVLDNFYQAASLDFCIALLNLTSKSKLFLYIHFASNLNSLVRNLVQSIHQWTHGYKTNCLDSEVHISTTSLVKSSTNLEERDDEIAKPDWLAHADPQRGAHRLVDVQPISSKGWWDCKTRLSSWGPQDVAPTSLLQSFTAWKKDFWDDTNARKFNFRFTITKLGRKSHSKNSQAKMWVVVVVHYLNMKLWNFWIVDLRNFANGQQLQRGQSEPAPTSLPSTRCPVWLSCGWISSEFIFGLGFRSDGPI
jgi:hypothetical protein